MLTAYLIIAIIFLVLPGIIFFDNYVIQNLSDLNKFKKWWRKHVIADYN